MSKRKEYTCEDCIHYDPCYDTYYNDDKQTRIPHDFLTKKGANKHCAFFQKRNNFIELPYGIGTTVYLALPLRVNIVTCKIIRIEVDMFGFYVFFDNGMSLKEEDFRRYAFSSPEEAKLKLRTSYKKQQRKE